MNSHAHSSLFFLILLLTLTACDPWKSALWERQGEDGLWSVEVPDFLIPSESLNEDAVLQLHAVNKDFFVVIRKDSLQYLRETQPDFVLEDFLDLSIERIIGQLDGAEVPTDSACQIHMLPAHVASISGRYQNQPILYRIAVIEGREFLYQILLWISSEDTKALYPKMNRVIWSFREER